MRSYQRWLRETFSGAVGLACGLLAGGCVWRVVPAAAALAVIVALLAPVDDVLALPPGAEPVAAARDLSGPNDTGPSMLATRTLFQFSSGSSGFKAVSADAYHRGHARVELAI